MVEPQASQFGGRDQYLESNSMCTTGSCCISNSRFAGLGPGFRGIKYQTKTSLVQQAAGISLHRRGEGSEVISFILVR